MKRAVGAKPYSSCQLENMSCVAMNYRKISGFSPRLTLKLKRKRGIPNVNFILSAGFAKFKTNNIVSFNIEIWGHIISLLPSYSILLDSHSFTSNFFCFMQFEILAREARG